MFFRVKAHLLLVTLLRLLLPAETGSASATFRLKKSGHDRHRKSEIGNHTPDALESCSARSGGDVCLLTGLRRPKAKSMGGHHSTEGLIVSHHHQIKRKIEGLRRTSTHGLNPFSKPQNPSSSPGIRHMRSYHRVMQKSFYLSLR